jgi:hypothetical protein
VGTRTGGAEKTVRVGAVVSVRPTAMRYVPIVLPSVGMLLPAASLRVAFAAYLIVTRPLARGASVTLYVATIRPSGRTVELCGLPVVPFQPGAEKPTVAPVMEEALRPWSSL